MKSSKTVEKPTDGTVGDSARGYLRFYILGPFFKMWEAIFELISPIFMSIIISQGLIYDSSGAVTGANWAIVGGYAGGMLAMAIAGFLTTMVCQYMSSIASQGTGTDLRNRLFKHVLKLSPSDLERYGISNAVNVITNDTNQVQQGAANLIRLAIRAPFLVIGALVASFIIDWKAGLIFLVLAVVIFTFMMLVLPRTSKGYSRVQGDLDTLSRKTDDSLSGARVVRAFNREDTEIERFQSSSSAYRDDSLKVARVTSTMGPVTTLVINIAIVVLVIIGAFSGILDDSATAETIATENGNIVALVNYLNQILQATAVVSNLVIVFTRSLSSIRRCNQLLAIEPSLKDEGTRSEISIDRGDVLYSLKDAGLTYADSDVPALTGVNIDIHKGDRIGIIGGTGSGKTTLLSLLLRFYDSTQGEVDYKGAPIDEYSLGALYSEIGFVPQRPQVFRGTVRSNLLLANPSATEDDMKRALDLALCSFVLDDPEGLDRSTDEGAKDLSGGQRQRLAIAMALVRKPQILILDDSYSALDFLSEKKLRDNLLSLGEDLTQIVVSERVSSLAGCDTILVLDRGRIESAGTHEELYGHSRVYTDICDVQRGEAR